MPAIRLLFFLAFLLTGFLTGLNALEPKTVMLGNDTLSSPEIKCIQVLPNGNTVISWQGPSDPNNSFNSYHIFYSASPAGPFLKIDSVFNYLTQSYSHTGANGNSGSVYYYIQTRSGLNGTVYSPPASANRSIFLTVSNPGTGAALLSWNSLATPPPSGTSSWYRVFREYPAGSWLLLDSVQNFSFSDTIRVCNAFISYRIELANSSGCTSVSNVSGANFRDIIAPPMPFTDSVSVEPASGKAVLGWKQPPAPDTRGYILYKFIGGGWSPVDTVFGINSLSQLYAGSTASSGPEEYRIAAFDSCNNISPLGAVHKTIYLQGTTNNCAATNALSWNNYVGWNVNSYKVFVSINNGPYTQLGSTTSTSFIHSGLLSAASYCYFVRAAGTGNVTSASSLFCVTPSIPKKPAYTYLATATVTGPASVQVRCIYDPSVSVKGIRVMRSDNISGPYVTLATVLPAAGTAVFNDETANPSERSYYYKAVSLDSCGNDAVTSNFGKTILLSVVANEDMINTLSWSGYARWPGNVTAYNIYRAVEGVFDPNPVAVVPGSVTTYSDDVSSFYNETGVFSYYVVAVEGPGNPYGIQDSSRSNTADAVQEHTLFIPNAFAPEKVNRIFQPKGSFLDKSEYEFYIFDRWGGLVFETKDYNEGWDGTAKAGKKGIEGVYVYLVKFKTSRGQLIEKKGVVMLIR